MLNNIDKELEVLRRDKEEYLLDLADIEQEIAALENDKALDELMDELTQPVERPNLLTDEDVTELVDAVYDAVAFTVASGAAAVALANGDVTNDSTDEHVTYVSKVRSTWLAKLVIDRLLTELENTTD